MEQGTGLNAEQGMSLNDYLRIARRFWKGIVALVALSTAAAFAWFLVQPSIYSADASGMVVSSGADNLSWSLAGDSLAKSKAKSYKTVAESASVADRVVNDLHLSTTAPALVGTVTVSVPTDSTEIRVSARSQDPAQAQSVANAWVKALAAQVNDLEKEASSKGNPAVKVVPLATALLPTSPVSPKLPLALGVGAVGGLLLGLAYAFVRDRVDRRIRTAEEAERSGHPVIGTLPLDERLSTAATVLEGTSGHHAMSEALRELRTNLRFIDVDHQPRIILVTSSLPSEGKSTVLANLASTLAADADPVIVIDGDLRRPNVHNVFGVRGEVGVTDILSGRALIDDVIQTWPGNDLVRVIAAGHIPPNPSELLGSRAMHNLLATLSQDALVLVDAPPLLPVTDAAILSRSVQGTLVVVRAGRTKTDELAHALGNLQRVKGRVLGLILNGLPSKGGDARGRGYYGHYGYGDPEAQAAGSEAPSLRHAASGSRRRGTEQETGQHAWAIDERATADHHAAPSAFEPDLPAARLDHTAHDFTAPYPTPVPSASQSPRFEPMDFEPAEGHTDWHLNDAPVVEPAYFGHGDAAADRAHAVDPAEQDEDLWLPARVRDAYGSRRRSGS